MRAKEVIEQKEIERYEVSIRKMNELSRVEESGVLNFISFIDKDGNFVVKTRYPIPSCRCVRVEIEKTEFGDILYFFYKIYFKGSFEKDFEGFLINGRTENYSFYGPIYDLIIFKEKPNKKEDYFQISFNSLNEFYEKLEIQRKCDLEFRLSWLKENKYNIYSSIFKYKSLEEKKRNLLSEIKLNKKGKDIYYKSIDATISPAKADLEYKKIVREVKELRKCLFYPKSLSLKELNLGISQNKIKIVSYYVDTNGDYIFYYYK